MMNDILFVLGGGIGNIIQAIPTIQALAAEGYLVDIKLHCNSSNEVDKILNLSFIRRIYTNESPENSYHYQMNGPFTPGKKYNSKKYITSKIHYAQHIAEAEVYYNMAKQIGVKSPMRDTTINVGQNGPCPKNKNVVALYPGSKHNWAMKRWDKFDLLAEKLDDVIVVGSHNDIHSHGNPAWIKRPWNWPKKVDFFSGTLREAAFLISKCKAFIGNDGGLAHVAAATGMPTFVLFGPSSDIKNKPYTSNSYVVAIDLPCRPCQFTKGKDGKEIFGENKANCPFSMKCMESMSVDYVLETFDKIMKDKK